MPARARRLLPAAAIFVGLLAAAPSASATNSPLNWKPCGDAPNVQCATLRAPLDYDHPTATRSSSSSPGHRPPEHRIGSLFYNLGGPGGTVADFFEALGADGFPGLNEHFDIIGMDPRGVGQSTPSIDCKVNQETLGIYSEPFTTPFNLDVGDLIAKDRRYINRCIDRSTTGSSRTCRPPTSRATWTCCARRWASASSTTSATRTARSSARRTRACSRTTTGRWCSTARSTPTATSTTRCTTLSEQTSGFERALGRFLQACAAHQDACSGFGGDDPMHALDTLIDDADAAPIPRRRLRRRTRGRSTATTSGPRPCSRSTRRRCGR